jgi:hypothetical protein
MAKRVSVVFDGVSQSVQLSNESYEILQEAILLFDLSEDWFLSETVKKYGVLEEMGLLRFIKSEATKRQLEE